MPNAILVTKRMFPETVAFLQQHAEVDYEATDDGLTSAELIARSRGKRAIVSQFTDSLPNEVIAQMEGLGMIAHVGVGYDNIDIPALPRAEFQSAIPGVLMTPPPTSPSPDVPPPRAGERSGRFVRSGRQRWNLELMIDLDIHHRTLGILGMGRIGQAVACRAAGLCACCITTGRA
jgi:gluconate 2-dehydrogenase